jgi:acyl-CoA synthetase (NDP forming)
VYAHNAPQPHMMDELAAALIERRAHTAAPVVVLAPGGLRAEIEAHLIANRIPVFHDTATCFDALACHDAAQPGGSGAADEPPAQGLPADPADAARLAGHEPLSETASADILRRFGLPLVASRAVDSLADARAFAAATGYPLVLKALAPGIAHKHAHGFVTVGIATPEALRVAYAAMQARVAAAGFAPADVPFIVQPMLAGDAELIAGVTAESTLGHFLVYGLGGIHAELFGEVTLLPVPVDRRTLVASIAASRVGRLLRAIESRPDALVDALAGVLDALQALTRAHGDRIASIDINPLLAHGDRLTAVDALVVPQ